MGVEGKTYEIRDGKYRFMDWITTDDDEMTLDEAISVELVAPYTNHPIVRCAEYAWDTGEGLEEVIEAAEAVYDDRPEVVWSSFQYSLEELDALAVMKSDIESYVSESYAEFLTGKRSFDEWDQYVSEIESMQLDEYLAIVQQARERVNAK